MKGDNYKKALQILKDLKKDFPLYTMAEHIASALEDYDDVVSMTDKEFVFALEKHRAELDMTTSEDELQQIIRDGMNLDKLMLTDDPYHLNEEDEQI